MTKDLHLTLCQSCNETISVRAMKCPKCNFVQRNVCVICKKSIPIQDKECPECGDPYPFVEIENVQDNVKYNSKNETKISKRPVFLRILITMFYALFVTIMIGILKEFLDYGILRWFIMSILCFSVFYVWWWTENY